MEISKTLKFFVIIGIITIGYFSINCGWHMEDEFSDIVFFKAYTKKKPIEILDNNNYDKTNDKNCLEWQAQLGKDIPLADIFDIQYNTSANDFLNIIDSNQLLMVHNKNAYIQALTKPNNKIYLEYLTDAKFLENSDYTSNSFESWENLNYYDTDKLITNKDVSPIENRFNQCKNLFLKKRYAFILLRHFYYERNFQKVEELYNSHLKKEKPSSIVNQLGKFYYILTLNQADKQYELTKFFAESNEKDNYILQYFDHNKFNETLSLTQNNEEKAIVLTINNYFSGGPILDKLIEIDTLYPNSDYINLLVGKEINKLEDWILSPKLLKYDRQNIYSDVIEKNYKTDINYLDSLTVFLDKRTPNLTNVNVDFNHVALAQLYYLKGDLTQGAHHIAKISAKANPSILLQKNIVQLLVDIKNEDINKASVQDKIYNRLLELHELHAENNEFRSVIKGLYRTLANQFFQKKNIALAGLCFNQSDKYINYYSNNRNKDYLDYNFIAYYDRFAKPKDVQTLINLIENKSHTNFERLLLSQSTVSLNYYYDLMAKLAFRQNDFELAVQVLSKIPKSFYDNYDSFNSYLYRDPFEPIGYMIKDNKYTFDKTKVISKLIALKKSTKSSDMLQLAHAYYNFSYHGNSWFMTAYFKGTDTDSYTEYYDFGLGKSFRQVHEEAHFGNYYHQKEAIRLYKKVLEKSTSNEEKALANFMLYSCNRNVFYDKYNDGSSEFDYEKDGNFLTFSNKYKQTRFYKKLINSCKTINWQ
jgi:hypothetical protein